MTELCHVDGPERLEGSTADAAVPSDHQTVPTATNPAGPPSRKRQRSPSSQNAVAQIVDSTLPDQHRTSLLGSRAGACPQPGALALGQQQQQQQQQWQPQQKQHRFTEAVSPACGQAHKGVTGMTCGGQHAGHTSSAVPVGVCNAVQTSAVAAELRGADSNQSRQQLQRPVLASLPSNQLCSADPAGTVLSPTPADDKLT